MTPRLTKMQSEVFAAIRDGKPNKVIAEEMGISVTAVKQHSHRLFRKFSVRNRVMLAMLTR